ncbi:MAG: alpha/beta fold hydrolase [Gammaproteobacteria bacterium]|nr:alpha/beta fold hydrolase [Gammaproteobacteria bacterium]
MTSKRLRFLNATGIELAGILDLPDEGAPRAMAVMTHCFTCHKNYKINRTIGRELCSAGIGLLRIDLCGLGESGGRFAETNFTTGVADIMAACDAVISEGLPAPGLLIGHSLGGTMSLVAAGKVPSCRAVATINAPFDPGHLRHHFDAQMETIMGEGSAEVSIGGQDYAITRQFIEDIQSHDMVAVLEGLERGLLILHAPDDRVVPMGNASRIFQTARHPKSFVVLDRADHLLSGDGDAAYAGRIIATWVQHYLESAHEL